MKVQYAPAFIDKLKKLNVRIKKSFKIKIQIFSKDPQNPELNNHSLHEPHQGLRSIDITADYRAIYEEIIEEGSGTIAYFTQIDTHKGLYRFNL